LECNVNERAPTPPHHPPANGWFSGDPATRSFLVIAATASVGAFAIAFDLGAHGAVFFDRLHVIWTVATATLLATFVLGDRWRPPWWGRVVLAVPSLWLLVAFYEFARPSALFEMLLTAVTVVTVLTLPYLAYALISVISPGFVDLPTSRLQVGAGIIAVALGLVGFGLGTINDRYLTCGDFVVSGNDQPANCRPGDPTTRLFEP
jgi:hypothetical protein